MKYNEIKCYIFLTGPRLLVNQDLKTSNLPCFRILVNQGNALFPDTKCYPPSFDKGEKGVGIPLLHQ